MTVKQITRDTCKTIRGDLNKALESLGKELGMIIRARNASYDDNTVTFKVECMLDGFDKAKDDFEKYCGLFNLKTEHYGQSFFCGGRNYKLVGLKPRSPKYPIIGEHRGSRYKLPERAVESLATAS